MSRSECPQCGLPLEVVGTDAAELREECPEHGDISGADGDVIRRPYRLLTGHIICGECHGFHDRDTGACGCPTCEFYGKPWGEPRDLSTEADDE